LNDSSISLKSPKFRFILETWTGRILIINTLIFFAMFYEGGSLLLPSEEILVRYGAKDTHLLIHGEYWRLFTPMFVHIGVIHFGLNSLALWYIGRQVELLIGGRWFLAIYLLAGVGGGIGSALFTMGLSAGASGAIFGLLGVGFVFERLVAKQIYETSGERLRRGPYTGLVIINIILGLILTSGPVRIDNGAHIGGLLSGIWLTFAMLRFYQNRFIIKNTWLGILMLTVFIGTISYGGYLGTSAVYVRHKVGSGISSAVGNPQQSYERYTEAIKIFPNELSFYYDRGRILMLDRQVDEALKDFTKVISDPVYQTKLEQLVTQLQQKRLLKEAGILKSFLELNESKH